MSLDHRRFVASLKGAKDVNRHYDEVDACAGRGEVDVLTRLAKEIEESGGQQPGERWPLEAVVDHIEQALALGQTPEHLEALGNLLSHTRVTTVQRPRSQVERHRHFASVLGSEQPPERLVAFLDRHLEDPSLSELSFCLANELVLRAVGAEGQPVVERAWRRMIEAAHPLSRLPSQRTSLENHLPLRRYNLRGSSNSIPFGPWAKGEWPIASKTRLPLSGSRETTASPRTELIANVVSEWHAGSNGKSEARTWELPVMPKEVELASGDLLTLGLACLEGASEQGISIVRVCPEQGFEILFAAAANGAAYTHGAGGAWGRFAAWQSTAGLLDWHGLEDMEGLIRTAFEARWFSFQAESSWYFRVAWDIGLAVLLPDCKSLAVFAATDTD